MIPITLPPTALNSDSAEVRTLDSSSYGNGLIYVLWGQERGDKMIKIFSCESNFRQYDDSGNVLLSTTSDLGIAQINQVWWRKAEQMGYDLTKTVDNIDMAFYVWNQQGFGAWSCASKVGVV